MNILLFSNYAGSAHHGMVFRNYLLALEWRRQGHQVTIVANSYAHTRTIQPQTKGRITEEIIDGIRYIWLWGPKYNHGGSFGRVLSMFIFTFQSFMLFLLKKGHFDLIIASSPHPFTIYPAYIFSRYYKAKLIYDIRDLWPLTLIRLGGFARHHPLIWMMQKSEDFACLKADLITAVPRNCEGYLQSRGLSKGRFLHIGNGASIEQNDELPLPDSHITLLSTLKDNGSFLVGYAGALGRANSMHSIIISLKYLPTTVHLVLVGEGAVKSDLIRLSNELGVADRTHFLSSVKRSQVRQFLDYIDIAYAGTLKSQLYDYGASLTKLNDYMLASKPILYAVGDQNNPVEVSGCGISCEAENVKDISEGIKYLSLLSLEKLSSMGLRGYEWCMRYQLTSQQAKQIISAVELVDYRLR